MTGAYRQGGENRPGGQTRRRTQKITVTKKSVGPKKLWLVSHKSRIFCVSKVFWPTPVLPKHVKCCVLLRMKHHFTPLC